MNKLTIDDLKLKDKRVLVRVDFNVPLNEKKEVADDTRIVESLPTIKKILVEGREEAILMSHLEAGQERPNLSLAPVVRWRSF
jgi:phosphoglycerate kinase